MSKLLGKRKRSKNTQKPNLTSEPEVSLNSLHVHYDFRSFFREKTEFGLFLDIFRDLWQSFGYEEIAIYDLLRDQKLFQDEVLVFDSAAVASNVEKFDMELKEIFHDSEMRLTLKNSGLFSASSIQNFFLSRRRKTKISQKVSVGEDSSKVSIFAAHQCN